jgi:hypothetical protein
MVFAALVVAPVAVAVLAASERSPSTVPAVFSLETRALAQLRIRTYACRTSADGDSVTCRARDPGSGAGTCTFSEDGAVCRGETGTSSWSATIRVRPGSLRRPGS